MPEVLLMSNEMTLEALRSVPLFASLTDAAATELRELLTIKNVAAGTLLFHKGDTGDAMYLIETGRVRISIIDDDQKEITLAELAQGDFFGEMSNVFECDVRASLADFTLAVARAASDTVNLSASIVTGTIRLLGVLLPLAFLLGLPLVLGLRLVRARAQRAASATRARVTT